MSLGPAATAAVQDGTRFFVPAPNPGAVKQIAKLTSQGRKADAARIQSVTNAATGVWVTTSTPEQAEQQVSLVTQQAADQQTLPLLVLYNIPFRDCAQYSSGGATSVQEYKSWIDGVVQGIGRREVAIAVEPDSLGIIPWYTNLAGQKERCQPAEAQEATAAGQRHATLNYAVDRLAALPRTSVYLDGTHSGWLNVGDISDGLVKASVAKPTAPY